MVNWTDHASIQLHHIHNYIAQDSPRYAKRVTDALVRKTLVLNDFPRLGHMVPEFNSELVRELSLYSYRIIYEIKSIRIDVLAVIHKRQILQSEDVYGDR